MLNAVHKKQVSVISIRDLDASTFVLRTSREGFQFKAGQFVNMGFEQGNTTREYSIYSGTGEDFLEFLIKEVPEGALSPQLRRLKVSDKIQIDGPYDEMFTISAQQTQHHLTLVATGTGIAPFHSFVKSHPGLNYTLLHGIRSISQPYDTADYAGGTYISCVSREAGGSFRGRVSEYLTKNLPNKDDLIYLCGSSAMIYEVTDLLRDGGFPAQAIFSETFF